jgi:hypothetical protein
VVQQPAAQGVGQLGGGRLAFVGQRCESLGPQIVERPAVRGDDQGDQVFLGVQDATVRR